MATVAALFRRPLGDDAALIPRTVAIAEAYQALFAANYERLLRWFPFDNDKPPTLKKVRKGLARRGQAWLDGSQLPLAIVVTAEHGWRLVGQVDLLIDGPEDPAQPERGPTPRVHAGGHPARSGSLPRRAT